MSCICSPVNLCTYNSSYACRFSGSQVPWGPWTPAKNPGLTGSSWVYARFLRMVCGNQIQVQSNRFLWNVEVLSGTVRHCYVVCSTKTNMLWCFSIMSKSVGGGWLQKKNKNECIAEDYICFDTGRKGMWSYWKKRWISTHNLGALLRGDGIWVRS